MEQNDTNNIVPKIKKTEDMKKYRKEYYKNNKEKFYDKMECKYCNCQIPYHYKSNHNKTIKHQKNVEIYNLKSNTNI